MSQTSRSTATEIDPRFSSLGPRYVTRTERSKELAQRYRSVLADPRVATRFERPWKELVYPIASAKSSGSRLWDIDGNEYIDITMGFGVHFFGHSPAFITAAIEEQLQDGYALGPQNPLAGEVAELTSALTGVERVAFTNTGTEAVMVALRVARSVTMREKVALFRDSYHGWADGVLPHDLRTIPPVPGVPKSIMEDVISVEYGAKESLRVLEQVGDELAAVLVEPVQSRQPDVQPRDFLHQLRALTNRIGAALIFDEMVTGFRILPGGAQEWFGVRADISTYGKVVGGGMPIGIVGGSSEYLDAIDGGFWSYGDASSPDAEQTFIAGTYVKHPLALAAARAVLRHLLDAGPHLQHAVSEQTTELVGELTGLFEEYETSFQLGQFGSMFRFSSSDPDLLDLLFYHLLSRGVHVCEARTCFLSTAHDGADCEAVIEATRESLVEMKRDGCFGK